MTNSHCRPCLGCTKNCFDFNPKVAFLADLHDGDRQWCTTRKALHRAFPGLVIAFFTGQEPVVMALAVGASAGSFLALEALLPASTPTLAAVYGAAAINLFYWSAAPGPEWVAWPLRAAVLTLNVVWLRRTFAKERVFLERQGLPAPPRAARLGLGMRAALRRAQECEVTFEEGGPRIVARPGTPLELPETAEQPIEAGCRMRAGTASSCSTTTSASSAPSCSATPSSRRRSRPPSARRRRLTR